MMNNNTITVTLTKSQLQTIEFALSCAAANATLSNHHRTSELPDWVTDTSVEAYHEIWQLLCAAQQH